MKIRHTISFKMIAIIILISAFLIGNLTYFNYKDQRQYYEKIIENHAKDFGDVLESLIMGILNDKTNKTLLEEDKEKIYNIILNFTKHDKKVNQIDIILPYGLIEWFKEFRMFVSTDQNNIDKKYDKKELIIRCIYLNNKIIDNREKNGTSFVIINPLR